MRRNVLIFLGFRDPDDAPWRLRTCTSYWQWDDCAVLYALTSDATQMKDQLGDLFDLTCTF